MRTMIVLAVFLLAIPALAGCSSKDTSANANGSSDQKQSLDQAGQDASELKVTADTGGIRGVVVDSRIAPVVNATISVANGPVVKSNLRGLFSFTGLKEGDYFLSVSKPGYTSIQSAVHVKANVANPEVVKLLIDQIAGKKPYIEFNKLDGFYECTFGTQVDVDSCDLAVRTAYDYWETKNATVGHPPTPRKVMRSENTQFIQVTADTLSVVQEGFWSDPQVKSMQIVIDSTPIDPLADNSDYEYLHAQGPSPTIGRLANTTAIQGQLVAARGFFPFNPIPILDNPSDPTEFLPVAATNFQFTVLTTLFHNYNAPAEWTFATQDQFPVGA